MVVFRAHCSNREGRLGTLPLRPVVQVTGEPSVPDTWRHLCLETLVTLAESAPAMVRKLAAKHVAQLVPQLLRMMVELDDEPDWATQDELLDEDHDRWARLRLGGPTEPL